MAIDTRHYALGTSITSSYPWGVYVTARAMCSDGVVRKVKRIALTADTFFSVPAAVTVKGKTVSGYVTVENISGMTVENDNDPAVAKFVAVTYGRNHALLPEGAWRPDTYRCTLCNATANDHKCAVAPTLADHKSAAAFYGTCPGDAPTQLALYPESAS